MLRNLIVLVLIVSATAGGVWAGHVKRGVDEVKTIDVIASQFKFDPATISVVEGDRVRLRLRSDDRTHGVGIKALRVKALIPKAGEVRLRFPPANLPFVLNASPTSGIASIWLFSNGNVGEWSGLGGLTLAEGFAAIHPN